LKAKSVSFLKNGKSKGEKKKKKKKKKIAKQTSSKKPLTSSSLFCLLGVMKHLTHRNIVRLFDVVLREPHLFLVLELCEYGDLAQLLRKSSVGSEPPRFVESRARFFAMQLRDGLEFLLERRIMHRDLKPQNLLLSAPPGADAATMRDAATAPYLLKIADFGFARTLNDSMAETICVPADHELLTSRGFMDLPTFLSARDDDLLVASYDQRSQRLVFERPLALKQFDLVDQKLVEFTAAHAWPSSADDDASTAKSSGLSLLVTRDHEMYVQHGTAKQMNRSNKRDAFEKVRASRLVDRDDVVARHLAYAANGVAGVARAAASVCESVGVALECAERLLQLYGFWLGSRGFADEHELRFHQVARFNVPWLCETLDTLALSSTHGSGDDDDGVVCVSVPNALWRALLCGDSEAPLARWVWTLDRASLCNIVDGLRRASLSQQQQQQQQRSTCTLLAASAARRDELVRLLLMAGFSAHFSRAKSGGWSISFATYDANAPQSRASQVSRPVTARARNEISSRDYTGRVWCFAMPSGFVWARRVRKDAAGIVTRASRPLIVGNCGSPLYMAPEVLRGDAYEQSADLFSVGAIVFEMLVGSPPFKARTPMELQRLHDTATVAFPANVPLSPACVALLSALLRKDVAQRLSHTDFFAHPWLRATSSDVMYNALVDACARSGVAASAATSALSPAPVVGSPPPSSDPMAAGPRRGRAYTSPVGSPFQQEIMGTSPGALIGLGNSVLSGRRHTASAVDAAEHEFLAQAVHISSEESMVRDIERRRKCALAVAEQAGQLSDSQPADSLALYVAALAAIRVALHRAEVALSTLAGGSSPLAAKATATAGAGATTTSGSAAAAATSSRSAMQPIRVSLALGSLRQVMRDIVQTAASVRDDISDSGIRRDSLGDFGDLGELRSLRKARGVPFVNGKTAQLIMERALMCGRNGAAAELQGTFGKSTRLYTNGLYLLTFLLDASVDDNDASQLEEYARLFDGRRTRAKQRAAASSDD
jgi:serine/threonine protein kinase